MRPVFHLAGVHPTRQGGRWLGLLAGLLVLTAMGDGASTVFAADDNSPAKITVPPAPPGARPLVGPPVVLEGRYFEIDGPDNASALKVQQLSQRLQTMMGKYFGWLDAPARPIQVQLVPVELVDFDGAFHITIERDGHRIVLIRWNTQTPLSDVCAALSSVTLETLVNWHNGPEAAARVPNWLKIAFGKLLEVNVKPALVDSLDEQSHQLPTLSLRQIMTAPWPAGEDLRLLSVNSYWLARYLEQECIEVRTTRALFTALVIGTDPVKALTTAFPDRFDDAQDLELWWQVGYRDITSQRAAPVQTMAETRTLLDRLQFIDLPPVDGQDRRVLLSEVWAQRKDQDVAATVTNTLLSEHVLLFANNPVYHNALFSLLKAWDALRGDDEKLFRDAWTQYQSDRADEETIEAEVQAAFAPPGP